MAGPDSANWQYIEAFNNISNNFDLPGQTDEDEANLGVFREEFQRVDKWIIVPLTLPMELPIPHGGAMSFYFRKFERMLHFYFELSSGLEQVAAAPNKLYGESGRTVAIAFIPIEAEEAYIIQSGEDTDTDDEAALDQITEQLSTLFDMALEAVNELIVIIGAVTRDQKMKRVALREVPSMNTLTLMSSGGDEPLDIPFMANEEIPFVGIHSVEETLQRVTEIYRKNMIDGHPFILPSEMLLMAGRFFSHEDYRLAVINLGTGFEAFISALLRSLMRERFVDEAEVQDYLENTELRPRVAKLGQYVSGDFDMINGAGPLGIWYRRAYRLRHRAVHAGYTPSKEEANDSIQQTQDAVTYLRDLVKRKSTEFPETLSYIDYDLSESQ